MATWRDVERAARDCPHLSALLAHAHQGVDREAALIAAVLGLSRALHDTQRYAADLLARMPPGMELPK